MKTLRIKCPSCGVILEVRNSKDEAVKRITCPNCKKQLAVTFADAPRPKPAVQIGALYKGEIRHLLQEGSNHLPHIASDIAEIKVACLSSGCKHILRVLSEKQQVAVNGQLLQQDDEVVLLRGDEVEISGVTFTFDKPGKPLPESKLSKEEPIKESEKAPSKNPTLKWILPTLIIALVIGGAIWYVTNTPKHSVIEASDTVAVVHDTVHPKKTPEAQLPITASNRPKKEVAQQPDSKPTESTDNDFDLETKAAKGNVSAQYQLGMRWVTSNDCVEVVKGVKYLELAARSGSANAQYALGIIFSKGSPSCGINRNPALARQYMQMAANKGHEKAIKYLESNNVE